MIPPHSLFREVSAIYLIVQKTPKQHTTGTHRNKSHLHLPAVVVVVVVVENDDEEDEVGEEEAGLEAEDSDSERGGEDGYPYGGYE